MKHVTSRKAHRGWERGGKGKTDDSLYTKGAERQHYSKDLKGDLAGTFLSKNYCLHGKTWRNHRSDCHDTGRGNFFIFFFLLTDGMKFN